MTTGEKIKARRKELGMSAEDLAKVTGRSKATIYRWENNDIRNYSLDVLESIAAALSISPAELLGESRLPADDARDRVKEEYNGLYKLLNKATPEQIGAVENLLKAMIPDDSDDFGA